jgi:hypothetical protein
MVVTKRFKPALVSVVVILLGVGIYSARLGQNPIWVCQEYIGTVRAMFGSATFSRGVFELRPLVHFLVPNFAIAEFLNLAIILASAGAILWVSLANRHSEPRERDLLLLQLCCLWGLMAVFHNPYDSILMLPVVLGLYKTIEAGASELARRNARIVLWIVQAALIIEVAGRWRTLSSWFDLSAYTLLGSLVSQFDRALILSLFVFIAIAGLSKRFVFLSSGALRERDAAA